MRHCRYVIFAFFLFACANLRGQQASIFKKIPLDSIGIKVYQVYPTLEGSTIITSSRGLWVFHGGVLKSPPNIIWYDTLKNPSFRNIKPRSFDSEDSIRCITQGKDSLIYFVSRDNRFLFRLNGLMSGCGWAPFNFPKTSSVCRIWIDNDLNLYAGTTSDNFFVINGAARLKSFWGVEYAGDKDSNFVVVKGSLPVKQIQIAPGAAVFAFGQDAADNNRIWIGTSRGLYYYDKLKGECIPAVKDEKASYTVTEINTLQEGKVWFSTKEKGMGAFDLTTGRIHFFPFPKTNKNLKTEIKTICYKSAHEFFLAVSDSFPAIFNTQNGKYMFFSDPLLQTYPNKTEDIAVDQLGKLLLVRNQVLFVSDVSKSDLLKTSVIPDSSLTAPYFTSVSLLSGEELASMWNSPERLKKIELQHNQNTIILQFGINNFEDPKNMVYAYKIQGHTNEWVETGWSINNELNFLSINDLPPGNYTLLLRARTINENWRTQITTLEITVLAPFWQTWWFWTILISTLALLVFTFAQWRINAIRKSERKKIEHEKELLELEARALRAQMNPHFIYNCLNSMKALIQADHKTDAINYLTTFSKLIRTLFQHSDKRQITLYDELGTCQMYTKLEAMRLGEKLTYSFQIDPDVDLKSLMVPALIIQPFIENAIWHGVVPKDHGGRVDVTVEGNEHVIVCIVEDNGIGRKLSKQHAPDPAMNHESRGVHLSQKRLDIQKILSETSADIEIIDKHDDNVSLGTKVIITFNLQ